MKTNAQLWCEIGLVFLILLFKLLVEGNSVFLRYTSVKFFIAILIIAASLVFPQYGYKEDARHADF